MSQELVLDQNTAANKNMASILYVVHALSLIFSLGTLSFIPLIINYVKRGDAAGTFVHSHHGWQIRSFWWYFVWMVVGGILFVTVIGIPFALLLWGGAWIWKAYRLIRGWIELNNNQPMPG
ncbi:MAG TPA: hypothetical protein VIT92_13185 [Burkholderiaceae bacterium]